MQNTDAVEQTLPEEAAQAVIREDAVEAFASDTVAEKKTTSSRGRLRRIGIDHSINEVGDYFDPTMRYLFDDQRGRCDINVGDLVGDYVRVFRKSKGDSQVNIDRITIPMPISESRHSPSSWEVCDRRREGMSWIHFITRRNGLPKYWRDVCVHRMYQDDPSPIRSRGLVIAAVNDLYVVSKLFNSSIVHLVYRICGFLPWPEECEFRPDSNIPNNRYCAANLELVAVRDVNVVLGDIEGWEKSGENLDDLLPAVSMVSNVASQALFKRDMGVAYVEHFTTRKVVESEDPDLRTVSGVQYTPAPEEFISTVQLEFAKLRAQISEGEDHTVRNLVGSIVYRLVDDFGSDALELTINASDLNSDGPMVVVTTTLRDEDLPEDFFREGNLFFSKTKLSDLIDAVVDPSDRTKPVVRPLTITL